MISIHIQKIEEPKSKIFCSWQRVRKTEFSRKIQGRKIMEVALGLSLTAACSILAIWINDKFKVGGELKED